MTTIQKDLQLLKKSTINIPSFDPPRHTYVPRLPGCFTYSKPRGSMDWDILEVPPELNRELNAKRYVLPLCTKDLNEQCIRIELTSPVWQTGALTVVLTLQVREPKFPCCFGNPLHRFFDRRVGPLWAPE